MKILKNYILIALVSIFNVMSVNGQCNTNTNICQMNSGPFNFVAPGTPVSTCLDFTGPDYGYVVLYITESGPLELLIDGDATNGYLDLAIFNIPVGVEPCDAILDVTNQISCNYASNYSGCNQIGNFFSCASSVVSPNVSIGDRLMIVVENWSGLSSNFSLELAPAPAAQSGLADPTINSIVEVLTVNSNPYQMSAVDNGGVWSGFGIDTDGLFDPVVTGEGDFDVTYIIGSGPCEVSDTYTITVNSVLSVKLSNFEVNCNGKHTILNWKTLSEKNSDYFIIEFSEGGEQFETIGTINSYGNSTTERRYTFKYESDFVSGYYKLIEVDLDGVERKYAPYLTKCDLDKFKIYPIPVSNELFVNLDEISDELIVYEIKSSSGKVICSNELEGSIDVHHLPKGVYFIKIYTRKRIYTSKFIRL